METTIYPEFKQAAIDANAEFSYGQIIPHSWLYEHFRLQKPTGGTIEQFEKWHFAFMSAMEGFRERLLIDSRKALRNIRGKGWLILEPKDQTPIAMSDLKSDLGRVIRRTAQYLENIATDFLSQENLKENAEAKAKIGALRAFSKKRITAGSG